MLLGCCPRPPDSSGSVAGPPPLDLSFHHPSASPAIAIPQEDGRRLPAPPTDDPAPGVPPGPAVGRSSVAHPHLSEYDCDLIWGRNSDAAVSGPPDERIVTVCLAWVCRVRHAVRNRKVMDFLALVPPDRETIDKSRRVDIVAQGKNKKFQRLPRTFRNLSAGVLCLRRSAL